MQTADPAKEEKIVRILDHVPDPTAEVDQDLILRSVLDLKVSTLGPALVQGLDPETLNLRPDLRNVQGVDRTQDRQVQKRKSMLMPLL